MPLVLPRRSALVGIVVGVLAAGAVVAARQVYPAVRAATNPRLEQLRTKEATLTSFTDGRVNELEAKVRELRQNLWTEQAFAGWRKDLLPGWLVQDLGATDGTATQGRRYAISLPTATAKDWEQIIGVLRALETLRCASVQSVNLASAPGFGPSRKFSTCQFIVVFFFHQDATPIAKITEQPTAAQHSL